MKAQKNATRRKLGRPVSVDGKKVYTYLDSESVLIAEALGNGNVSAGIRAALRIARDRKNGSDLGATEMLVDVFGVAAGSLGDGVEHDVEHAGTDRLGALAFDQQHG